MATARRYPLHKYCIVHRLLRAARSSPAVVCRGVARHAPAAKSRNHGLMQQLLKHKDTLLGCAVFPEHWFVGCAGGMHLRLGLSCSCAALAGGDLPMLRQLLLFGGSLAWTWRGRLLLRYAARHSSAECLQELLFVCQVDGSLSCRGLPLVAPQHLTMAASRSDAWAAGEQSPSSCTA
eukprot:GHRQ01005533.1.p3 GENE.GHRQ01005533.1~~GHRQ01005533.1.p3  ORF type:complete len:178 (+),score=47.25 GHRQ01005533.1:1525-2058(+)